MKEVTKSRHVLTLRHRNSYEEVVGKKRVTLLSQATSSRGYMLPRLIEMWSDPINIALLATVEDAQDTFNFLAKLLTRFNRPDVTLHVVVGNGFLYPVNWMRNLVLHHASSEFVFHVDIDFLPSRNLVEELRQQVDGLTRDDAAIIVPAFEMMSSESEVLPTEKSQILEQFKQNNVQEFHRQIGGQALWNVKRWLQASQSYIISAQVCDIHAEPYMVLRRSKSPFYPETLVERGWNKVAYHFELCIKNFQFSVVSDGFLLHRWHEDSKRAWNRVLYCTEFSFRQFQNNLVEAFGTQRFPREFRPWFLKIIEYSFICQFAEGLIWSVICSILVLICYVMLRVCIFKRRRFVYTKLV